MDKIKNLEDKSNDLKLVSENSQRISVENSTNIESLFRTIANVEEKTYKNESDIKNLNL